MPHVHNAYAYVGEMPIQIYTQNMTTTTQIDTTKVFMTIATI